MLEQEGQRPAQDLSEIKALRERWFTKRELSLMQENSVGGGAEIMTNIQGNPNSIMMSPNPLATKTVNLANVTKVSKLADESENSSVMVSEGVNAVAGYNVTRVKYQTKNEEDYAGEAVSATGPSARSTRLRKGKQDGFRKKK